MHKTNNDVGMNMVVKSSRNPFFLYFVDRAAGFWTVIFTSTVPILAGSNLQNQSFKMVLAGPNDLKMTFKKIQHLHIEICMEMVQMFQLSNPFFEVLTQRPACLSCTVRQRSRTEGTGARSQRARSCHCCR